MIPLKFKEMLFPDYMAAYTIINKYHLKNNDIDKINALDTSDSVKKAIKEILGIK
ncbi:hypothetical protein [Ferroplasma sp.]|jgi:hypothetical protein|uniref:hypothetical protein n=1 Tax=Ferroplasma sp. TaxID=2591003 RepID=UPI0026187B85|nr:hypothetical protein [Ferroplasma sp.]